MAWPVSMSIMSRISFVPWTFLRVLCNHCIVLSFRSCLMSCRLGDIVLNGPFVDNWFDWFLPPLSRPAMVATLLLSSGHRKRSGRQTRHSRKRGGPTTLVLGSTIGPIGRVPIHYTDIWDMISNITYYIIHCKMTTHKTEKNPLFFRTKWGDMVRWRILIIC